MQNKVHGVYQPSVAELVAVYQAVSFGVLSVADAAQRLGISRRQMYRRLEAWNSHNGKLPQHGNTGRVAKNRLPDAVRNKILELVETKYYQFPPQLLTQYLNECEGITVSKETVRRILREANPEVWDEGTKNGPDRSALLGHNFVYQETKPHGFYSSYFHQRISS